MPIKYKGMTIAEHRECGKHLEHVTTLLRNVKDTASKKYPKNSDVMKRLRWMSDNVDRLSFELDNCLSRETTRLVWEKENLQHVYYRP